MERVFTEVNNGVYRCGFAGSQETLRRRLRAAVGRAGLARGPARRPALPDGRPITEADVRLFTTLVRFDAVYHGHFKCNRNKLTEMPVLWAYARDLFQTPGFGDTIDFAQIKPHYYVVHRTSTRPASCRAGPTSVADAARPRGARRQDDRALVGRSLPLSPFPAEVRVLVRRGVYCCAPRCRFLRAEVRVLARRGAGSCGRAG